MINKEIEQILIDACEKNASDIYIICSKDINSNPDIYFKIDNETLYIEDYSPKNTIVEDFIKSDSYQESGRLNIGRINFRYEAFVQVSGTTIVIRPVLDIRPLEVLDPPRVLYSICDINDGIVLISGKTGSGKSTTLAALVNELNKKIKKHILVLEDPIEFLHSNLNSIISQREINQSVISCEDTLRGALRSGTDILVIGELRDYETIKLALRAAESGMLVLATIHSSNAVNTLIRIIDMFEGTQDFVTSVLADSLRVVINQKLFKRNQGGKLVCHEVMIPNPAIKNYIRSKQYHMIQHAIETGKEEGMMTMEQSIKDKSSEIL